MNTINALVTGASRGIGRAIATRLAGKGVQIILHCQKNLASAEDSLASLPGKGHRILVADLTKPEEILRLWQEATAAFGRIHILVNNAAIFAPHPPLELNFLEWQRIWNETIGTNLLGPAHLSFLACQSMNSWGGGRIVNLSSRGAFRGEPKAPAYGASKAGLNALSQSLAKALAPRNVFVFVVAPGWVNTEMAAESLAGPEGIKIQEDQPLGRIAEPDEVAKTVAFCALEAPASMTGSIIDVNGASYLRT